MNDTTQTQTTMHDLLARWAEVEPEWCKQESKINQLQPREREQLSISTPYGWQTVFTEADYHPDKFRASMAIQMIVQAAIVARGWYFELCYSPERISGNIYGAEVGTRSSLTSSNNPAEALLSAYLKALGVSG